jgi:hypothetical protein
MKTKKQASTVLLVFVVLTFSGEAPAQTPPPTPPITGTPRIDFPALNQWPTDRPPLAPDLTELAGNTANDVHASFADCDIVLSTVGNIHMALRDLWFDVYLPGVADLSVTNWMYTTSPPISPQQVVNRHVGVGNFRSQCVPQVAIGPTVTMNKLRGIDPVGPDLTDGMPPVPITLSRGNVILVKKGNPKNIQTIWDLGRDDVRVVTSNPVTESSSFSNYRDSIFQIAYFNPQGAPAGVTAQQLFDRIFNNQLRPNPVPNKWLAGMLIHHREVPWSISEGHSDAGLIFYHLAKYIVATFPDQFDIVPLGGTVSDPAPLQGNRIATQFAVRIGAAQAPNGNWTPTQDETAHRLMNALRSAQFGTILESRGLLQPPL